MYRWLLAMLLVIVVSLRPARAAPEPDGGIAVAGLVSLGSIGGPPQSVSRRVVHLLDDACRRENLALLNYPEATGDYRLQGDLKAMLQNGKGKLIYRWRVFDTGGVQVAQASGREVFASTDADPWNDVPEVTLEIITRQAIAMVMHHIKTGKRLTSEVHPAAIEGKRNYALGFTEYLQPLSFCARAMDGDAALRLINGYRRSRGREPLVLDSKLLVAASKLANDMAQHDRISHTGPNGANLGNRLTAAGYAYLLAAENVSVGQSTLTELVDAWKEDVELSRNILLPDATQMGIACKYRPDTKSRTYWNLIVAAPATTDQRK